MKLGRIFFIFFISSILLIVISIKQNASGVYREQIKKIKTSQIQMFSNQSYLRRRKLYVPKRSFFLARQEIKDILLKEPIPFELNDSSSLVKFSLIKIVKVVNHLKEDVVLSISAHTDVQGTAKYNLYLSQKRADRLKEYFVKKTNLPLVVSIGYGETFSLKSRLIEINLKRIKR